MQGGGANGCGLLHGCGLCGGLRGGQQQADGNGGGGMVGYPYYTLHGPRDFLQTHPQSIGP